MASRDETISMVVRARDEASGVLNSIQDTVGRFANIGASGSRSIQGLTSAFGGLGAAIAGAAIISSITAIGDAIDDLARRGAVFQQLGSVLGEYAKSVGESSRQFLEAGRQASAGTIDDYTLVLNANRAIQFEVAKTSEQYAQLIELATALGRAQGISDTQALGDLTTGIARESRLILDNLGLIISLEDATKNYADSLGKKASALTSAERKQAILNEAFKQGKVAIEANRGALDSAATQFERMDSAIQNSKDALGALFAPAVAEVAQRIADAAQAAATAVTEVGKGIDVNSSLEKIRLLEDAMFKLNRAVGEEEDRQGTPFGNDEELFALRSRQREIQAELTAETERYFAALRELYPAQQAAFNPTSIEAQTGATERANAAMQRMAEATGFAAMEASYLAASAIDGANGLSQLEAFAWSAASGIDAAANAMVRMNAVAGNLQSIRTSGISQLESTMLRMAEHGVDSKQLAAQYGQVADQIWNMGLNMDNTNEAMFENKLAVQAVLDPYQQQLDAIVESERAADKLAKSTAKAAAAAPQLSEEFRNVQQAVSSVLSGSLNVDVGVDTEKILGREDAINEDARRLADVAVKGFDSPWYAYFKEKFPALFQQFFSGADGNEGLKKQAAQMLRDFEDGLRPELINRDLAKERVRRMLLGEQNTKAMVEEIAKELAAEMGISIHKVRAAAGGALGLTDMAASGAAGEGVPVDIKPVIDQTLLTPITTLTSNPQNVVVKLDTAEVDGTAIAGELAAKINITITPGITWTEENINAASQAFPGTSFSITPSIVWDNTMLDNARTYIANVAFGIHPNIIFDDTNASTAITALQSYAFAVNPVIDFSSSITLAQTEFAGYAFALSPTITWDTTMLGNAQTYIASLAFSIYPTLAFDGTNLDTALTTLQNVAFEINPLVSFAASNIDAARTAFASYMFEVFPTIAWDAAMVASAQAYIGSVAFPINPTITFDTAQVESAKTTLESYAFAVNPFVSFDGDNIGVARTTLQGYAFSVQPFIDFTADLANAQSRLASYAFEIAPTINTGTGESGFTASPFIDWTNSNLSTAQTEFSSFLFTANPVVAWDTGNIETAKTTLSSNLFTVNPYIDFNGSNLDAARLQLSELFNPTITPQISLISADGTGVDYTTPAQMLAQGFTFAFMTEFDVFNPGQYVVEQLTAKIAENYQLLDEGAKGMGQRWGNMFLSAVSESVPVPLIELLTTLVTPAVRERLSQEASQRGATYSVTP